MVQSLHFPVQTGQHRVSFHDGFDDIRGDGIHCGIDIGSHLGTPIYSATLGTVVNEHMLGGGRVNPRGGRRRLPWSGVDTAPRSGNFVIIADMERRFYLYAHMQNTDPRVQPGHVVTPGQIIGHMGNTGRAGPVHLHFQVWVPFRHPGAEGEYREMRFRRRFGRAVNPFQQLKEVALSIPGAIASRGDVPQPGGAVRRNVEGVIIDPPTPEELRLQREAEDRRLDELMVGAGAGGPFPQL